MERLALATLAGSVAGLWVQPSVTFAVLGISALVITTRLNTRALPACVVLPLAYCWAVFHAVSYQNALPEPAAHAVDRNVSGCITDFPRVSERGSSFLFSVASSDAAPERLYLRSFDAEWVPAAGQCYDLQVRLKPPHGLSNPGQFDRQRWLMAKRVTATGYVRRSESNVLRVDLVPSDPMLAIRSFVRARIRAAVSSETAASLLEGLTVGVRSGLSQDDWAVFRATGTVHLMSISGLHVGLVAGGIWALVSAVCDRLSSPGRCRWPAFVAASACAVFYALLAGWSVPTSRAALMFVLLTAAIVRHRAPHLTAILSVALIATLVADPFAVLSAGFWMSFLAVALLMTLGRPAAAETGADESLADEIGQVAARGIKKRMDDIVYGSRALVRAQWRLTLGLTAPNIILFDAWAVLSPVVNLVAIPLFSLFILPLVLASAFLTCVLPFVGEPVLQLTAGLLEAAMIGLTWLADSAWAQGDWLTGNAAVTAILIGLSMALLMPGPLRCGPIVIGLPVVALSLVLLTPRAPLQIDVLDVGQGTAVLIRTAHHAMLVDTGPAWPGGDAGKATVTPFLRRVGIRKLDAILVSHADTDHRGGLNSILDAHQVDRVLMPAPAPGSGHKRCARGMRWQWDEVTFSILHPADQHGWTENEASCVLQIGFRATQVLLPGDIETAAEAVLAARQPDLQSDLVLAPHHGSNTSSGEAFAAAVRPIWVVYTTAFLNRWGFPKAAVTRRWQSVGACELNTAQTGALAFAWQDGKGGLILQSVRKAHWSRPWAIRPDSDDYCAES